MRQELIGLALGAALIGGLIFAINHRAERVPGVGAVNVAAIQAAAKAVTPGFVGVKRIGAWEVSCTAEPVMVAAGKKAAEQTGSAENSPPLPLSLGGGLATGTRSGSANAASTGAAAPGATPAGTAQASTGAVPAPGAASEPEKISLGRCRATQAFRRKDAPKAEVALAVNFRIVGTAPGRLGLFVRLPAGKEGEAVELRVGKAGRELPVASCGRAGCMAFAVLAAGGERELIAAGGAELVLSAGPSGNKMAVRLEFAGLPAALGAIRRAQS